jgi:hypothetical protein
MSFAALDDDENVNNPLRIGPPSDSRLVMT